MEEWYEILDHYHEPLILIPCPGAPIDITGPGQDDPDLGADPNKNDNFDYTFSAPDDQSTPIRSPFAAHIRKMNPRGDLGDNNVKSHRIIRNGIPFGPEVTDAERNNKTSTVDRGLLFVSYQSSLGNGFRTIQESKFRSCPQHSLFTDLFYQPGQIAEASHPRAAYLASILSLDPSLDNQMLETHDRSWG